MATATRIIYLVSGILIMASGLYIQMSPGLGLSEVLRLLAGLGGISYFGFHLYRFLAAECTNSQGAASIQDRRNFGLDFMEQ